jgi:hypothetical protein
MTTKTEESNKALVLEAFDTLFNKRLPLEFQKAPSWWNSVAAPATRPE